MHFEMPIPINEPVKEFRDGSIEKKELLNTIQEMKKSGGHTNDH